LKIQLIKIGRPAHSAYTELSDVFYNRLKPTWKIENVIVKAHPGRERAGQELFPRLGLNASGQKQDPHHIIVALDERGKELSSPQLAQWMQERFDDSFVKQLSFVIGGPYGLHEDVRRQADLVWSLAKGVYPSDLAWVMVWEQLYRASSILRNSSYHHE
jgi:23S rRNA (pseudouridine1915-N3)-methyltransferase